MDLTDEGNIHIMVTSQSEPDIKDVFGHLDKTSIDIGTMAGNKDITEYIKWEMQSKSTKLDNKIWEEVASRLRSCTEGS